MSWFYHYQFSQPAVTEHHTAGGLCTEMDCLTVWRLESKIEVLAGLAPPEATRENLFQAAV